MMSFRFGSQIISSSQFSHILQKGILSMQVSFVASESAFSMGGRIISPCRSCLTHLMVEVLMCTEQWLKQDIHCESRILSNAQIFEDIEQQKKEIRGACHLLSCNVLAFYFVCLLICFVLSLHQNIVYDIKYS